MCEGHDLFTKYEEIRESRLLYDLYSDTAGKLQKVKYRRNCDSCLGTYTLCLSTGSFYYPLKNFITFYMAFSNRHSPCPIIFRVQPIINSIDMFKIA